MRFCEWHPTIPYVFALDMAAEDTAVGGLVCTLLNHRARSLQYQVAVKSLGKPLNLEVEPCLTRKQWVCKVLYARCHDDSGTSKRTYISTANGEKGLILLVRYEIFKERIK